MNAERTSVDSEPTDGNPIRLAEIHGTVFATRYYGQLLLARHGDPTSIDFDRIEEATYSFLDAYVGGAAQRAVDRERPVPELRNVPEHICPTLRLVFAHRGIKYEIPKAAA